MRRKTKKIKKLSAGLFAVLLTIALCVASMPMTVSAAPTIPTGAHKMSVRINGRAVLDGYVFATDEATYVPMFKFADWLGQFSYEYDAATRTASVVGKNLEISASQGDLYICANGRYFYTSGEVLLHNGEIYIPIRPLVKALNCYVDYDSQSGYFIVRSGDTSLLKRDSQVYNSTDIYWLARIISAEAQGESLQGKIAVGNVVLNRMRSSQFPNSIYGVIFDKKYGVQFTPVANGSIYNTPTDESVIAAKICYEGYSLSSEILYFVNPRVAPSSWAAKNRPYAFTVGNHSFYK